MAKEKSTDEETQPLTAGLPARHSEESTLGDSADTASTTSLVLEHLNDHGSKPREHHAPYSDEQDGGPRKPDRLDIEDPLYYTPKPADRKARRILWILGAVGVAGWVLALVLFITNGTYQHASTKPHDPAATASRGSGRKLELDQVLAGQWRPRKHGISWIKDPNGGDGLLLERGQNGNGKPYLMVEDVRHRNDDVTTNRRALMIDGGFYVGSQFINPVDVWPSRNLRKVLVMSNRMSNWRHSYTGNYWIFDVDTQTAEPLDPALPSGRVQLALWSPDSKAIVFTRDNNMFIRHLRSNAVEQITRDGGSEVFNGVPDWVYEEEVFASDSATWWSEDGNYVAFLRTNESAVPTYPVQYFISRPSLTKPKPGEESYPEVRHIKYPKAGAPNPIVNLLFYDLRKKQVFTVPIADDFPDADRLITEVVWAGHSGKVIVRSTNRESDILKVILVDVERRSGKTVRQTDVNALDGGWFEVSETTTFIQSDPGRDRPHDGYIDTIIHEGNDHLAYFTPLENPEPRLLTSGDWEVVKAPSAVDLVNNVVYFVATKDGSTQRHVYRVKLDGTDLQPVTDTSKEGYYDVSFSDKAGYALLSYNGPNIPWQKIISTPSNSERYQALIEDNSELGKLASQYELPIEIFQTVNIDGFELNLVERRPPHFDEKKKYPVLFWQYQGPGSQSVDKKFNIDFQAFVASKLGYIVVTLDGRGTGFRGRRTRCIIRGNIGHYEALDQIAAAKMWAKKKYVDADRMAIWGWSYGGFMALKTLEQDAGETFKYGMAVAPVTDWRYYDSIYTERYMHTPQHNPGGYDNTSISQVRNLAKNVRFLVMHGVADDNVHMQNTLELVDNLDLAGVENYDMHMFPDSDHSIYFHNANHIVYDKLADWLTNAFNGEWLKIQDPKPVVFIDGKSKLR